ncbi:hypothetical protein CRG98_016073 [Punica granatum]|uniref:Uncharacterized protein n=1 Tax=Punica granatum TaxID=22663 RepID=A0A2I0K4U0_PUNGR|nr:hypothetical protein CRG98_016073 [Punica granatum]
MAESRWDPFSGRRCNHGVSFVVYGLGHTLFVETVACDLCGGKMRGVTRRDVHLPVVALSVRKKLVLVSFAWEGGSALGPRLALSWKKGEGRKWPARKGRHDSPVVRGGWPGWTASGHNMSRYKQPLVTARLAMER